jgi:cytoskeletal protein CcmA (bactofilin family)
MFAKPAKSQPVREAEAAPARKAIAASLVAENVTINGDLATDGDVQLDGTVRGDLRVGRLSLGDTGCVEGSVEAEAADVRGRVIGPITARQVRLHPSAEVVGDITHEQLVVEPGARFQGRSQPFTTPSPAEALPAEAAAAI